MTISFYGKDSGLFWSAGFQEMTRDKVEAVDKSTNSYEWAHNVILMVELRKKLLVLRDFIDLPPCDQSAPVHQLILLTVEDLRKLYPNVAFDPVSDSASIHRGLFCLYGALDSVCDQWAGKNKRISDLSHAMEEDASGDISLDRLGEKVLTRLNRMINIAKELPDEMDEDVGNQENQKSTFSCPSPDTTTGYAPVEFDADMKPQSLADTSYSQPLLLPLRIRAVNNLRPFDMKCWPVGTLPSASSIQQGKFTDEPKNITSTLAEAVIPSPPMIPPPPPQITLPSMIVAPPPPPPPVPCSMGSLVPATPSVPGRRAGAAPPPPLPSSLVNALRAKKAATKLKRSTQIGKLYRTLKGKVEGVHWNKNSSEGKRTRIGGSSGGKQGMADALAEMARRSSYFKQIEEDVEQYGCVITELKSTISNFKMKDMAELLKFHLHVEQKLEKLTDETQVLARFEGFPTKKLEAIRASVALYSKLDGIAGQLKNWKKVSPLKELLAKSESYFNKIKVEIEALERSKDEEMKRFKSQGIDFDFDILVRIKESMVDVSSGCMELALEERREAKAAANGDEGDRGGNSLKSKACVRMLWQAFQLAFKVYNFAGGHDDRADRLTQKLAEEIEADPIPNHPNN